MTLIVRGSSESTIMFKDENGSDLCFIQRIHDGRWVCGHFAWTTLVKAVRCALTYCGEPNPDEARCWEVIKELQKQAKPEV